MGLAGGTDRQHGGLHVGSLEPLHEVSPDAAAGTFIPRAVILPAAFTRNHQDAAAARTVMLLDKGAHAGMGLRQRHAMQIDPALDCHFSLLEPFGGPAIQTFPRFWWLIGLRSGRGCRVSGFNSLGSWLYRGFTDWVLQGRDVLRHPLPQYVIGIVGWRGLGAHLKSWFGPGNVLYLGV